MSEPAEGDAFNPLEELRKLHAAGDWPEPPALVYIGTDGTKSGLDHERFEPSRMTARERVICRALLEYAAQKLANFDAMGGSLVTQGPQARPWDCAS
jgi:hypothetical protein